MVTIHGTYFRVLNEFVWFYGIKVNNINGLNGQILKAAMNFVPSDDNYTMNMNHFEQKVFTYAQHLALGFFREGISSGSAYYEFLCYAKIFEIPFENGRSK